MLIEEIFEFLTSKFIVKLLIPVVAFGRKIVLVLDFVVLEVLGVVGLAVVIFVEVIEEGSRVFRIQFKE